MKIIILTIIKVITVNNDVLDNNESLNVYIYIFYLRLIEKFF